MGTALHRAFALNLVVALGLAGTACKGEQAGAAAPEVVGVYSLVSVDGRNVPATVLHDGVSIEVRSGRFTIDADGTCHSRTVFVSPSGAEVARDVSARYTVDGSKLTMRWEGAGTTVGIIEGDTFTMRNDGMDFVYRK